MRTTLAKILRWQSSRLIRKHKPTIVVVSGSVGKTSTTQAIITVLSEEFAVRGTLKNYNTDIGVPCSIFGRRFPQGLKNPFAWAKLLIANQLDLLKKPSFTTLVLELGTDKPGELADFSWLSPDIAVVTAVAQEHMEQFKTLDAVAQEELTVSSYSAKTLINKHMIEQRYLEFADSDELFNYAREDISHLKLKKSDLQVLGAHSIDAVAAGIAVGKALGMSTEQLKNGAKKVQSQPGRMKQLEGIKHSVLIDDTYNSSPEAVIGALDCLYGYDAPQKIVLLGNMNELGAHSHDAHQRIGEYCDPKELDLVVTLGEDANHHTADAAKKSGCRVVSTQSPYEAAVKIKEELHSGGAVLLKGSQNGVFAEEAVKLLLENPEDAQYLVRQDTFWQKIKSKQFKDE